MDATMGQSNPLQIKRNLWNTYKRSFVWKADSAKLPRVDILITRLDFKIPGLFYEAIDAEKRIKITLEI